MQLIPVLCAPSVRMFFDSDICQLEPQTSGNLQIRVSIPKDSEHHYLMILFKLKTNGKVYVGPNLVAFIKIVDLDKPQEGGQQPLQSLELASSSLEIGQF